jgi:hypothetical protein
MKPREFKDLTDLLQKRTRDAAMTVIQLADDDDEAVRTAMLIAVAVDFIEGAAQSIQAGDGSIGDNKALATAFSLVGGMLGKEELTRGFLEMRSASKEKSK